VKAIFEENERMSIEDHVANEFQVILDAYGKVASKRIMDEVPMFVQKMVRNSVPALQQKLERITDVQLSQMMHESHDFVLKHRRASEMLARMNTAVAALRELHAGTV
jgi:hypothetical protein